MEFWYLMVLFDKKINAKKELKESNKNQKDFNFLNYDENSMPLYSAMIRVGEMPLNNKFLMHPVPNPRRLNAP